MIAKTSLGSAGFAADLFDCFSVAFQRVENFAVHSCADDERRRVSEPKLH
jgi:hypothetical protein